MNQSNVIRPCRLLFLLGCLCGSLAAPQFGVAEQTASLADDPGSSAASSEVIVGINGLFRVGCWTGIRIEDAQSAPVRVETEDGDGVSVSYVREPADTNANGSNWTYAICGSEAAPLIVEQADGSKIVTRFPPIGAPSRESSQVPLGMPWIVSFGDPLGVDEIGENQILKRDASVAVSQPTAADQLPDAVMGYEGVDLIMVGAGGTELLAGLSSAQQQAIVDWVQSGGRIVLMLGGSLPQLESAAPWLLDLLPAPPGWQWSVVELDPSAIETFTSTQNPLSSFTGAKLPKGVGEVIITGRTTRRVSTPIAAEYIVGLGKMTVIAADLHAEPFVDWPQRLDLVLSLTGSLLQSTDTPFATTNRSTAYDDLAGQMRSTLDQFKSQRRFGFSLVSLIVLGLIALIGPLDYFLVNRLLGKPLLGWLTFPVMAIAISVLLVMQARAVPDAAANVSADAKKAAGADGQVKLAASAAATLHANRFEILDIDSASGRGEMFTWNTIYSHDARQLDVAVSEASAFQGMAKRIDSNLTFPFGFPGRSFGAIQVSGESARLPGYEVLFRPETNALTSQLVDVPFAPRSSKSIASQMRFVADVTEDLSMRRRSGSELLEGSLRNPFPVDVLNGMLIYRNWLYLLPTRFPAGSEIESVDSLRQKNFRWQLSRQKALESSTETESWDPSSTTDLERLAEMMMFHDVVGAERYTGLRHEVLSFLDLSDVLTRERCMLIGKLARPVSRIRNQGDPDEQIHVDETLSLIRLVMPISAKRR
ncbi:putative membrane protein [Rhodopirellula maiorica SM1]|uniref:Putative membrane protein n=1 Tax=Rhodopirellula maiorica SM1 TaxID=1265738 RepID=M5RGV5_9BACT|nr:PrgI family protein [Rhodopirellula maiorica]EMI18613.1 putative membrane protein [Rhodopirellula maiorica SM1]